MDELSRKFRSIDWKGLQKSARRVQASTASALKDMVMTDLENKVRAATADTSWGASGSDLMQIAQGTFNREDYALIMSIVWQRLGSSRWRCVYKALEVLRHLIMHGAARCATEARAASHHIQTLQHFRYVDPKTRRDHGEGVRTRAKLVCDMLEDEAVLEEEREKSKELRSKLQGGVSVGPGGRLGGLSSDDYQYGVGGSAAGSDDAVTRTTAGAGAFKGYGDDNDADGAYDDVPTGTFAKRAAAAAGTVPSTAADVPDLLGDGLPDDANRAGATSHANVYDDDDDDDDFDPRAGKLGGGGLTVPAAQAANEDLFGSLALVEAAPEKPPPSHIEDSLMTTSASGPMPTSLLVQSLAQKQNERQHQSQSQSQSAQHQASVFQKDADLHLSSPNLNPKPSQGVDISLGLGAGANANGGGATGSSTGSSGMGGGNDLPSSGDTPSQSSPVPKPKITSKPDADPFGDLVASARKSGVL